MAPSKQYDEGGQLQLMEADRVDEEEECFESIDKLISQGINAGDVKKLQDAGIYTCNGQMMHTKKSLTGIKGLSEAKVDKICEAAEKLLSQGFMTGSDLLIKRKSVVRITTGSQALDELLGGGIETLCITEAFGEFRSGKTQLAHTLCVTTQLPLHMHGGNEKVAYIDTEGTFRPERIVPIAERFGMDANAVLDNIIYARAYTYEHQYNLLLGLAAKMAEEPFRLLIVDSVIALFRVDFSGRGELAERQSLTRIKGLSEAKVDKICEAAEKLMSQGFMTGSDLLIKRKSIVRITTGSQALDELLGGGIETHCITEAFGEFRSGKTQLAHTLCVTTQLPLHMHGGNGKVAYIDTEGTFRPERIVPIAERFGMDANAVLDNVIYARAYTYEHQYNLLLGLAAKMAEEPFRLLIVDSVIALFRVDFSGRGELAERQSLTRIKGLSEAKVDKICEAAEKLLSQGFMTGSDLLIKKRKSVVRITTGSQALDKLLGGGIEILCITETFGEFRSGKTQLAHTLCVTTQLPLHMHGGNGKVAYIDTEGTFRPERIVPIAERFGMDANAVLDNIIYARAYTYEHQYNLLLGLAAKMAEDPFRLLIVNSVIALFHADFSGRGELAEHQCWISAMASYTAKNCYHIGGLLACSGHKSYHPFDPWSKGYDIRNTVTRSLNGSPTQLARSYDESVIHVMNWLKSRGTEISFSSVLGKKASLFTTPSTGTFHYLIKYEDEGVIAAANPSLNKIYAASLVVDARTGWCYAFVNAKGIWVFQPKDPNPYIQNVGMKIIPLEAIYSEIAPEGMVEDIEIGIDPARNSCMVLSEYDGSTDPTELRKVMIAVGRAIFPVCEGFKFRQVFELNSTVLRKGISTTLGKSELPETSLCVKGWAKISSAANGAIFHYLFHKIPMWPFRFKKNYGRIKTVEQAVKYINIATYGSVNTRMSKRHERTQWSWSPVDHGEGEKGVHLLSNFDVSKLPLPFQERFKWESEFFLGDRVGGPAHWTAVQFLNKRRPRELNPYRGTMPVTYGDKAPSSKLTNKVRLFSRAYPDGLVKLARAIRCLKK